MTRKHVNVGLFSSVYSYFLYLLIKGYDEDDIIIVYETFPREIAKNINPIIVPTVYFKYGINIPKYISKKGFRTVFGGYFEYIINYIRLKILLFKRTRNRDVEVYGYSLSVYSFIFYINENSNIIEDGMINYTEKICKPVRRNPILEKIMHIFGIYYLKICEAQGTHENIKNIYLTKPHDNPLIKDKVRVVDIEKRWNELSEREQTEILNIFNMNLESISFEDNTVLILTEPLSEDDFLTLEQELTIYTDMISKFENMKIIIKPHPRDFKNYNEIFPDAEVINRDFPIELLNLINIRPTVVASVICTALLNFKNSEIYVYDGELFTPKMKECRDKLVEMLDNN